MFRSPHRILLVALVVSACANELVLPEAPPPPGPGSISGRATFARPGRDAREPAAGAQIQLLGTSIAAVAGQDGYFFLAPIVADHGTLLIRWDSDQDGTFERQRVVRLEDIGAGPNRPVALGDVSIAENARLEGRVRLSDKLEQRGGHAGTIVLVPEAPFLTTTADDGSFALAELPAGALTIVLLRDGYAPITLDGLTLQPGQQLTLRDQILEQRLSEQGKTGKIQGKVSLEPVPSGNAPITVTAIGTDGKAWAATVADDGSFEIPELPSGVYQVVVSRPGYVPAVISGVAVTAEATTTLSPSVLVPGAPASDCHEGDPCTPDDACRQGAIHCVAAGSVCVATEHVRDPGSACGRDAVCSADGACVRCQAKAPCTPENACHSGQIACASGTPVCEDTGAAVTPGSPCGTGRVCSANGTCEACDAGSSCDLEGALACHVGAIACTSGGPDCRDIGFYVPAGTSCGDGLVCNPIGTCVACRDGAACIPADPCHQGTVRCDTGVPRCVDTGALATTGTACGDGRVCGGDGTCNACEAGKSCVPADSCHLGTTRCETGLPVCEDLGTFAASGTPCGADEVCAPDGTCAACATGAACELGDEAPCHLGALSCETGQPACGDVGLLKPAGTACGNDRVCNPAGSCVTCVEGGACTPPNTCHVGVVKCDTGGPRCVDTGARVTPGQACGTNLVCDPGGSCVTCRAGATCTPEDPCHAGQIVCDSGAPECEDLGTPLPAGAVCGPGRVCAADHTCNACPAGTACQPSTPCRAGQVTCDTGAPVCSATSVKSAPGTSCGTDQVCDPSGACTSCVANQDCAVANPCHVGRTSCASGVSQCVDTGASKAAGAACGTNQVCSSAGACVSCTAGAACTPANPCHDGAVACSSGAPVCVDQSTNLTDGTVCGTGKVCNAGACVACAAAGACTPANPCHNGLVSCSTGAPTCVDQGTNATDGAACGTGKVCKAGGCVASGMSIVAGDGQSGYTGQLLTPITFRLLDGAGNPLVNQSVTVTATAGAWVTPANPKTDLTGSVLIAVRLGRAAGTYTVSAVAGALGRADATATATEPPAKTIYTLVNTDHSYSNTNGPDGANGPATAAHLHDPRYFARASDGTLYVSDLSFCVVRRMLPDGTWQHVAGTWPQCNSTGDGGAADKSTLAFPAGLYLDEPKNLLYVAENTVTGRVRVIDLARNLISTYAGGTSTATGPGFGDSGPASAANLSYPTALTSTPDGSALLVFDGGHKMLRKIDRTTTMISTIFGANTSNCALEATIWSCSNGDPSSCSVAWDASGNLFIAAQLCGAKLTGNPYGIVKYDTAGKVSLFAAQPTTGTASGVALTNSSFPSYYQLAFDAAQNLYLSEPNNHRIRMIEAGTGRIVTVVGNGTSGYAGDFVPASSAQLWSPAALLFEPDGSAFVADAGNGSVQRIAKFGASTPASAILAANGPTTISGTVGAIAPTTPSVKLTDAQGNPLSAYMISWRSVDPGGAVPVTTTPTNTQGTVTTSIRAGLLASSTYRFEASFKDPLGNPATGSPVTFTVNTTAPASGTIFSVLDTDHSTTGSAANMFLPGPASLAHVKTIRAVATASDGTMYVADRDACVVYRVGPAGDASIVAGTPFTCATNGDGGLATQAAMNVPVGVAISKDQKTLYVSEYQGGRVRAVDLATGSISTYAGGTSVGGPGYGDGAPANTANLSFPTALAVNPVDGALHIADSNHTLIRRVDPATNLISTFLRQSAFGSCPTPAVAFYGCGSGGDQACAFTFDGSGNLYVSGTICSPASYGTPGLLKYDGTTLTLIAGNSAGSTADGQPGSSTLLGDYPAPTVLPDGSILLLEQSKNRIRRWDPVSKNVYVWAGGNTLNNFAGEFQPLSAAQFWQPFGIANVNGHVLVTDQGNAVLRMIW